MTTTRAALLTWFIAASRPASGLLLFSVHPSSRPSQLGVSPRMDLAEEAPAAPAPTEAAAPTESSPPHRAGFVSIVGKPNVGKSTLMNAMLGSRLSIITSKAQTTRHRIMGILNDDDVQIVYSDTPGVLIPQYKLQEGMMRFVQGSINDADVIIVVVDIFQDSSFDEKLLRQLQASTAAMLVLLNKIDLLPEQQADDDGEEGEGEASEQGGGGRRVTNKALGTQEELAARWEAEFGATVLPISARCGLRAARPLTCTAGGAGTTCTSTLLLLCPPRLLTCTTSATFSSFLLRLRAPPPPPAGTTRGWTRCWSGSKRCCPSTRPSTPRTSSRTSRSASSPPR